ncbi:hypothetical protein FACS1894170_02190 [Planctomycetales bacterium]|nr:hypothetical protein FACS1894170_02190 [Planctomycetales bacterium]
MAKQKAWHEVVTLRNDLRSGELAMNLFAADLYEVLMQRGKRLVYEKPEEFFALTFPTYNLRHLVRDVVLRLAGQNDKAVRQLELTYGGGKTHTLITLFHLVNKPAKLPDLPAVKEFIAEIEITPPQCRIAGLCFDKLDVEKGMEVRSPNGKTRMLKEPWSILAYQLAGDTGLKLLNADDKAEERDSAPAENLLTELLELPLKENLGTLILIDEVLMYAREKVAQDKEYRNKIINFFQYLTQAAAKVNRCCLVASLLATDPRKSDMLGRDIQGELYNIFQRQREEAVEPVVKEDVAEVLRRRFFTPDSIKDKNAFRPHVVAALKGIKDLDEQTGKDAEERFLKSFPFHPDLTEILYSKWTQLANFQRTRGVLRTFALALREAEKWDTSPLIGPAVFLAPPDKNGLSEALREMVTIADTEEWEGKKQAWTGILDSEFQIAKDIQQDYSSLVHREIEQAAAATFLHSQPVGQTARTHDLIVLRGISRPDKIELDKALCRWAEESYWLDDQYTLESKRPTTWRLGNRPNLTQMHAVAVKNIHDDIVRSRLISDIGNTKSLTEGASAAGASVHLLPNNPKDIQDDGKFHYAVLGLNAVSENGKPNEETKRFLDETTSEDRPRIYRNAIVLLVPSKEGVEGMLHSVRTFLAWETVREELKKQQKGGTIDAARAQTLTNNIEKAKGKIRDMIRSAYSVVVTVNENNEAEAFRLKILDDSPHFSIIKRDDRSRIQDIAITAEALLPNGPYDLWKDGETSRRVKVLEESFAQFPHLPKMLKTSAIFDTLANGCEKGTFVLQLLRPDGTKRMWWKNRPDDASLKNPALELVLPTAVSLTEIAPDLLSKGYLPNLWTGDEITVNRIIEYFNGHTKIQVGQYEDEIPVPKMEPAVIEKVVATAVEAGKIWLLAEPSSICGESIPLGILSTESRLLEPPALIQPAGILPENIPAAWKNGSATGLSFATALSQKDSKTLPWATVQKVIQEAIRANFIEYDIHSISLPCDFSSAKDVCIKTVTRDKPTPPIPQPKNPNCIVAESDLEISQIQDLADNVSKFLEIKTKSNVPIKFRVRIEIGDGSVVVNDDLTKKINAILKGIKKDWQV